MFQLIKNFVNKLSIEELDKYAKKNNILLSDKELNFCFKFIKRNYEALYANPNLDLSKYKNNFSDENYEKIINLIKNAKIKYARFL